MPAQAGTDRLGPVAGPRAGSRRPRGPGGADRLQRRRSERAAWPWIP